MRFKFDFTQSITGVQKCEAIIQAETIEEARLRLYNRDFTTYIIIKQDTEVEFIDELDVKEIA